MKISYAITVCNELKEVTSLINFLLVRVDSEDQIVIQYDSESATKEVIDYLNIINDIQKQIKVISFPLNKDFASFKNNLKSHCEGDYIFQIDADEEPSEILLQRLKQILTLNEVDIIFVPRVNTVKGLTNEHIQKWGWKVNENGWVNFPDYQTRLYRRTSEIEWQGKVHERIVGYNTLSVLPQEEQFCLYHHKQIERQEKQNELYDTI